MLFISCYYLSGSSRFRGFQDTLFPWTLHGLRIGIIFVLRYSYSFLKDHTWRSSVSSRNYIWQFLGIELYGNQTWVIHPDWKGKTLSTVLLLLWPQDIYTLFLIFMYSFIFIYKGIKFMKTNIKMYLMTRIMRKNKLFLGTLTQYSVSWGHPLNAHPG